jgi:predicted permease
MKQLWRRFTWLFRRRQFEAELEEELRHHLALMKEPRNFGNTTLIREDARLMWMGRLPDQLMQDVRYGLRAMIRNKLFTAMAVLSLALGIGANTAIYSFVHAVLLRQLPVAEPGRLVSLNWSARGNSPVVHGINGTMWGNDPRGQVSPNFPYESWRTLSETTSVFQSLFAYAPAFKLNVVADRQAFLLNGVYVSGNYYSGLGVGPARGRVIVDEDDRSGAPPVAVISYDCWRSRFAARSDVVGRSITINNIPFTVVGVSAAGFAGTDTARPPMISIPLHAISLLAAHPDAEVRQRFLNRNFYWLEIAGRLRPGIAMPQAETVLKGVFSRYVESTVNGDKERRGAKPQLFLEEGGAGEDSLRRQYGEPVLVLMTMVALILAIACANVANLMLSRATARRREIAVRLSLGAGRWRLVRQLMTESLVLSLTGAILGLPVAFAGIRGISWLISDPVEGPAMQASLDWPVLAFTFGLAVLSGVVFGLAPALQSTRQDAAPALKETRAGSPGIRRRFGIRTGPGSVLIVSQIAMSLVLATAAGLFIRTLVSLNAVDLGFNRENLLVFSINARDAGYKGEGLIDYYDGLLRKFSRMPGVRSAALSGYLLVSFHWDDDSVTIPGSTPPADKPFSTALMRVDSAFLPTMQIPMLLGRGLEARDMQSPRVAVVSELFAKKYFPGMNPLGRRIGIGDHSIPDIEIVGVAKTTRYNHLQEETPTVAYVPYTQDPAQLWGVSFEIRTAGDPLALAATVRRVVHDASPTIPIDGVSTQSAVIDSTIAQQRTFADLCSGFAILALLIACVGLYGTMSYAVERRTSEIGIRMALGAKRGRIVWMVLRRVCALVAVGLAAGLATAWSTGHYVASFLYGVKPDDLRVMAAAAGALIVAAIAAGSGPAWRASRIDPMAALRHE